MREEFGDLGAGLAVFFEFVARAGDGETFLPGAHAGLALVQFDEVAEFLAEVIDELWFVVEKVLL